MKKLKGTTVLGAIQSFLSRVAPVKSWNTSNINAKTQEGSLMGDSLIKKVGPGEKVYFFVDENFAKPIGSTTEETTWVGKEGEEYIEKDDFDVVFRVTNEVRNAWATRGAQDSRNPSSVADGELHFSYDASGLVDEIITVRGERLRYIPSHGGWERVNG